MKLKSFADLHLSPTSNRYAVKKFLFLDELVNRYPICSEDRPTRERARIFMQYDLRTSVSAVTAINYKMLIARWLDENDQMEFQWYSIKHLETYMKQYRDSDRKEREREAAKEEVVERDFKKEARDFEAECAQFIRDDWASQGGKNE